MTRFSAQTKRDAARAVEIADMIRPILAGHPPELQGAVLADLLLTWIIGHEPDSRPAIMSTHMAAVMVMVKETIGTDMDPWANDGKKPH